MRSLVLHVQDDNCLEERIQVSLDIARTFGAHLTCVQPIAINMVAPADVYGLGAAELVPILRENAAKLQQRTEAELKGEDVPWSWIQKFDAAGHLLLAHAALSDLIVLGAMQCGGDMSPALVGQVAVHARTPVLMVPKGCREFDVSAPALVAWNGSIEASHALRAAVPLLKHSQSVKLITVDETREEREFDLPPTEGAEFLSRHGIECEMVALPREDGSVQDVLRRAAQVRRAGYIVMGAYGHPRLRELVLGGVTRGLISDPPVPLFLCH